jgi:hypothetical protein
MANYSPVPKTYKGKDTNKMSETEYNKMLKELPGYQTESKVLPKGDIKEPDMGSSAKKKVAMAKGGSVKGFKACASCPSPAKCKAAGKCMKTKMAKGGGVPAKGKVVKSGSKAGKTGKTPILAIMVGIPKKAK